MFPSLVAGEIQNDLEAERDTCNQSKGKAMK
jgi:hypothetical protein